MTTYLVFYDRRGQAQRVATTDNPADVQSYVDAGFVIVTVSEYNTAAALVPSATLDDLPTLAAATEVLAQIQNQQRRMASIPNVDPEQIDRLRDAVQERNRQTATDFTEGRLTPEQWYRQMVDNSNRANIAATALATGGIQNLSDDDLRAIERANETQTAYLNRFRRDTEKLSPLEIIARSLLYGGLIGALFYAAQQRAMGMPPLPAQPGVLTSCQGNCRCRWDIQTLPGNGNWNCIWTLAPVEHCDECLRRSQVFNPLEIRNGVIQPFSTAGIYT